MNFGDLLNPPGGWPDALAMQLGMDLWRIPVVVLSAIGVYLAFVLLVRLFGVRVLTGWNGFDVVIILMFGAVAGRAILGNQPTLVGGVVGLATLMAMECFFGSVQSVTGVRRFHTRPTVIMAHGKFIEENLHRTHLTRPEVYGALRKAGICHRDQVQCVILEATGGLSIIREGQTVDPALLDGVRGAESV